MIPRKEKLEAYARIYIKGRKGNYPCKPETLKQQGNRYCCLGKMFGRNKSSVYMKKGTQRTSCSLSAFVTFRSLIKLSVQCCHFPNDNSSCMRF